MIPEIIVAVFKKVQPVITETAGLKMDNMWWLPGLSLPSTTEMDFFRAQ
jgi:hypothetical protein